MQGTGGVASGRLWEDGTSVVARSAPWSTRDEEEPLSTVVPASSLLDMDEHDDAGGEAPALSACPCSKHARMRWRLPMLALRAGRLEPLQIGDDDELDKPLPLSVATAVGDLGNGVRYYVRANSRPAGRATLRLVVRTGSLAEADDQLGLAHLIEHCAFLRLKSFEQSEIKAFFSSIGASFGADANAHTGYSETVYKLAVPLDAPEVLERAMLLLSEWAFGIVFDDALLQTERDVVRTEWRQRDTASFRLYRAWLEAVFSHDQRFSRRFPIGGDGTEAGLRCVESAPRQRIVDYYSELYRPELTAVIVVGDFPNGNAHPIACTATAEALPSRVHSRHASAHADTAVCSPLARAGHGPILESIQRHFGAWARTPEAAFAITPPRALTALRAPPPGTRTAVAVLTDAQLLRASLDVGIVLPHAPWTRTARCLRKQLVRHLWLVCLQLRYLSVREAAGASAPFVSATPKLDTFEGATIAVLSAVPVAADACEAALRALLTHAIALAADGPSDREFALATTQVASSLRTVYARRHERTSTEIADELATCFASDEETTALISYEYRQRLALALLRQITACELAACGTTDLCDWREPSWIVCRLPSRPEHCTEDTLRQALADVIAARAAAAPAAAAAPRPSMEEIVAAARAASETAPPLSVVAEQELPLRPELASQGAVQSAHWQLSNGASVSWCRTTLEADRVHLLAVAPGGLAMLPKELRTRARFLKHAEAGLGRFSPLELLEALDGTEVQVGCTLGELTREAKGMAQRSHLGTLLVLTWASLKMARLDQNQLRARARAEAARFATMEGVADFRLIRKLHELTNASEDDPYDAAQMRAAVEYAMTDEALPQMAQLRQMALADAPMEAWSFVLVGALPPDTELRALLCKTLGGLDSDGAYVLCPQPADAAVATGAAASGRLASMLPGGWPTMPTELRKVPAVFAPGVVYEDVIAGEDAKATAVLVFPCSAYADGTSAAEAVAADAARKLVCVAAQRKLHRRLRDELGSVYSVLCAYKEDTSPDAACLCPARRDPHAFVQFVCQADVVDACVDAAIKLLVAFAPASDDADDYAAAVEQAVRGGAVSSQTNVWYLDRLRAAVVRVRCGSPAGVWPRAASVPPGAVAADWEHSQRLARGGVACMPTQLEAEEAARDCFQTGRRVVVCRRPRLQSGEAAVDAAVARDGKPAELPAGEEGSQAELKEGTAEAKVVAALEVVAAPSKQSDSESLLTEVSDLHRQRSMRESLIVGGAGGYRRPQSCDCCMLM